MRKVIKEIKEEECIYQLGYNLYHKKVYPYIEIYKDEELLSGGIWCFGTAGLFFFNATYSSSNAYGNVVTMEEMFTELRKYHDIPEEIEKEYEKIFIMYKLNDFNEI
jgi:hypothetical protein